MNFVNEARQRGLEASGCRTVTIPHIAQQIYLAVYLYATVIFQGPYLTPQRLSAYQCFDVECHMVKFL